MCTSLGKKLLLSRTLRALGYNFYKQNSLVSLKTTKASRTRSLPRIVCRKITGCRSIHPSNVKFCYGHLYHSYFRGKISSTVSTLLWDSCENVGRWIGRERVWKKRKKEKKDTTKRPTRAGRGLKAWLKKTQKEGTTEWILEQQKRDIAWRTDFVTNNSPFRITTFVPQSPCLCAFFNAELRSTYWRIRVRTRDKCFVFTLR